MLRAQVRACVTAPNRRLPAAFTQAYERLFGTDVEEDLRRNSGRTLRTIYKLRLGAAKADAKAHADHIQAGGSGSYKDQSSKFGQKARKSAIVAAVAELYKAGEDRWGTDEKVFMQLAATNRSYCLELNHEYQSTHKRSLHSAIRSEIGGRAGRALAMLCTLECSFE